MRRLRKDILRPIIRETVLKPDNLILPIFVDENISEGHVEISSMPGYSRYPISGVSDVVNGAMEKGLRSFIVFGIPSEKDEIGTSAYDKEGVVQKAVREIKKDNEDAIVITDVCLCEYMSHGHCGIVRGNEILNDETLPLLGKTALSHAEAGADVVAPSGMMDGMVGTIRESLDKEGFEDTVIMSYAAKYASNFYGPFRDAAESGFSFGDRKSYQMDFHNSDEALREVEIDIREGADIIMVKPALSYMDIIRKVKDRFRMPTAAYNVSGEYSMVKAAGSAGWIDEKGIIYEILVSLKRAGADLIITYHALEAADLFN